MGMIFSADGSYNLLLLVKHNNLLTIVHTLLINKYKRKDNIK